MTLDQILGDLGLDPGLVSGGNLPVVTPIDGSGIGAVQSDDAASTDAKIARAEEAYRAWRVVPAPRRGELIRLLGEELRAHKEPLGRLVTLESGKILAEGMGEVQEMVDICDFALGLSRQLYGLTMASERPGHRMMETWHPLGPIAVITAFNFPVAVWSWNFCAGHRLRRFRGLETLRKNTDHRTGLPASFPAGSGAFRGGAGRPA